MGSYAGGCVYGASKAGIIGLTMSLARKLAEHNITVNAVAPGPHETEMIRGLAEERRRAMIEMVPLKKLGKPKNLAEIVAFLASDNADFITGFYRIAGMRYLHNVNPQKSGNGGISITRFY